jgi:hypothetical protein
MEAMNPTAKARLATYATGAVGIVGLVLAGSGLAEFDHETGMIDLAPFNAYALAALLPGFVATILAQVALIKGWAAK